MDVEIVNNFINEEYSNELLVKLIENIEKSFLFPELDEDNLREKLWKSLYDLIYSTKDESIQINSLSLFRILSRDKKELDRLIFANDWLNLLQKLSGLNDCSFKINGTNKIVIVEAMKCLCNLVFNSRKVAKECCENGILDSLNDRIKSYKVAVPIDIKFFDAKLMFIITAICSEVRERLRNEKQAITHLVRELQNLKESEEILNDIASDFACEILKALFNLTLNLKSTNQNEIQTNEDLVNICRDYLLIPTESVVKRIDLHNNIVNLLTNIPILHYNKLIPEINKKKSEKCIEFKGHDVSAFKEILKLLETKIGNNDPISQQLEIASPVATVLYKGALADRNIRKYLRAEILPPLKDVHNRPEDGTTIRNYLCRLLTSPITQLRDIVAEFLFILCKKSVNRMIKYTGYGNAAGLFARRGLLDGKEDKGAADFSSDSEDSETEEYAEYKNQINPVLGCFEPPHPNAMENMTEEQKEYEAMKLVQLMNDLTRTGTIKPCKVGQDGKPEPIEHVLQLQENMKFKSNSNGDKSDSE